jgi:hypothetical protein
LTTVTLSDGVSFFTALFGAAFWAARALPAISPQANTAASSHPILENRIGLSPFK